LRHRKSGAFSSPTSFSSNGRRFTHTSPLIFPPPLPRSLHLFSFVFFYPANLKCSWSFSADSQPFFSASEERSASSVAFIPSLFLLRFLWFLKFLISSLPPMARFRRMPFVSSFLLRASPSLSRSYPPRLFSPCRHFIFPFLIFRSVPPPPSLKFKIPPPLFSSRGPPCSLLLVPHHDLLYSGSPFHLTDATGCSLFFFFLPLPVWRHLVVEQNQPLVCIFLPYALFFSTEGADGEPDYSVF